ncbi:DUF892 family protein [Phenylobacterium sp.]|jgi:ferritin-like metal-binding protein YciE/hemerythrin superfamily protein|uniref:DUF892 family protein n=1 Tax=Phenylobacterium sp. TaxID=1871053 RepID=UPI002F950376
MRHEKIIVADRGAAEPISFGASVRAGKKVRPDAIGLLVLDHVEAMAFFDRYERSDDPAEKLSVVERLCMLLMAHMQVEEEIFYPAAGSATGDEPMVDHARDEHQEAKGVIDAIRARSEADSQMDELVATLRLAIQHHVEGEETSLFPEVRQAGRVDLYDLGAHLAARRVELLFHMNGMTPREGAMQTSSDMDVATTGNLAAETMAQPVSPEEARKMFLVGLRNAHATEQNCRTMVTRQIQRLENYPKLKARLEQHLTEVEAQIARLDVILERMGEDRSGLKDAAMSMMANMSSMMNAAAGDEILKNSFANAAMAQFEIAAYKSLLIMGEAAGETEALRPLQQSLNEERAMAAWLEENLPGTVIGYLQLRSQGGVDPSH